MKKNYKYATSLTSQISFCAVPLRLDPYNHCQFSCTYCFAKTRQGHGRDSELQIINPETLRKRLERVSEGRINSALDEFIMRRIPFQLGGMSDPFGKIEEKEKKSLAVIKILNERQYPFIVSTKSTLIARDDYLEVLCSANAYVRFSTTVVSSALKPRIDVGCPPFEKIAEAAKILSTAGIPVAFRFQPIIPGFEDEAFSMLDIASSVGVKHISAEYLKVPIDANLKFGPGLIELLDGNPIAKYISLGAKRGGREYALPMIYRGEYLSIIYRYAKGKGLTFGFADNDLLIHSDGLACCSASNLYLKGTGVFNANIVGLAKIRKHEEELLFNHFYTAWMPRKPVSTYLNSRARILATGDEENWRSHLRKIWMGEMGLYAPDYFDGIVKTQRNDATGLPIFMRLESDFERGLRNL